MVSVIQKTHVTNKGPQKLMTIQMSERSEFFNVPLIASSYGGVDLGLKSHMNEAWDDPWVTRPQLYHYTTEAPFPNISIC